jgi:hypothetical protein
MNPTVALAALLSTLAEVKEGPESSFYLPFMGKLHVDTFQQLLGVLVKMDLAKVENHYVTFTQPPVGSKGEQLLLGVQEVFAKAG